MGSHLELITQTQFDPSTTWDSLPPILCNLGKYYSIKKSLPEWKSLHPKGLKVFDNSVENLTSRAWNALGSAWREGTGLIQRFGQAISEMDKQSKFVESEPPQCCLLL
ncbi:hypothetical protein K1719_001328 [Acacia pycnantha]|nr:hypothetical protein K1719_001328 [Acacia pycnantha]